jgi:hypothetical protein
MKRRPYRVQIFTLSSMSRVPESKKSQISASGEELYAGIKLGLTPIFRYYARICAVFGGPCFCILRLFHSSLASIFPRPGFELRLENCSRTLAINVLLISACAL